MTKQISYSDIYENNLDTIIDVRSPSEYTLDHILGSINLPALSDEERKLVGTVYKQESPFEAKKLGAAIISRNLSVHLKTVLFSKEKKWRPLIYCWRGGHRSSAFATVLSEIGWKPLVLNGGYKNYRKVVVDCLHREKLAHRIILISGNTGSGKTEILQKLNHMSQQIIDLESLANHKGSIFGATSNPQPSQRLFESHLYDKFHSFDSNKVVFMEAESNKIGQVSIPPAIWRAMKSASRIEICVPIAERARYLKNSYKNLTSDTEKLNFKLDMLSIQQGTRKVSHWKSLSNSKNFITLVTELLEDHYDPRYKNSRSRTKSSVIRKLKINKLNETALLESCSKIIEMSN